MIEISERVETIYETPVKGEEIVRSAWRHAEFGVRMPYKDKAVEKQRRHEAYLRNQDAIKKRNAEYRKKHRQRYLMYSNRWYHKMRGSLEFWKRILLYSAKQRATKLGIPFALTLDDIHIPKRCPVLGLILKISKGKPSDNSPSLDRIIPAKGYVFSNVIVVSYRANILKKDATPNELVKLARFYGKINT